METAAPQQSGTALSARITARTPEGGSLTHDVTANDNLIVGSSPNCSLQLESVEIAAMHCLIALENGRLRVQDWYTTSGTFLNGEKIQHPVSFAPGDEIRIGDFRLSAEFLESSPDTETKPTSVAVDPPENTESGSVSEQTVSLESVATDEPLAQSEPERDDEPVAATAVEVNATQDTDRLQRELQQLRARVTDLEVENEELRMQPASWGSPSDTNEADPFDAEMVELLKAEVEQLQDEVTQRDARIAELQEEASGEGFTNSEETESTDTAVLVERLENLLEELQRGDEHVATLEDLLRSADEATQAEQEERRQLGVWVKDIEQRIGEYEAGWQADREAMQAHIDKLTAERERFDERLRDMSERQGSSAQTQMIEELRAEVETLTSNLQTAEEARKAMREKIDSVEFQNSVEAQEKRVEEMMREERLQLAQEHAQMARERAELARTKAEIERATVSTDRQVDDATCRVQAFREHLKDIHKEEKQVKETGGLSARLARLWKRLDGR